MFKSKGLLIGGCEKPTPQTLMYFISSVVLGSGLTILTRSEEAYRTWTHIVHLFHQAGFSKENLDVYLTSDRILRKSLQNPGAEFVIMDGGEEKLKKWSQIVLEDIDELSHLPSLFGPLDAPDVDRHKRYLKSFVKVRSQAINIMRHGAPLESL